jgi:hypothetical protein
MRLGGCGLTSAVMGTSVSSSSKQALTGSHKQCGICAFLPATLRTNSHQQDGHKRQQQPQARVGIVSNIVGCAPAGQHYFAQEAAC